MSFLIKSMILFVAVLPSLAWASDLDHGFSTVEVKKVVPSRLHKGCIDLEAEVSGPLRETPTATIDAERADGLDGVLSRIMEVFSLSPTRYHLSVQDPDTCRALKSSRKPVSIVVEEGKGSDGGSLFPYEKKIRLK